MSDKVDFSVNGTDLYIVKPSPVQISESQKYYNKTFGEALQSGAVLRAALDRYLARQKVWDDEKEKEYNETNKKIQDLSKKLTAGGMKLSQGKNVAIEIKNLRAKLRELNSGRLSADTNTAEGQADQSRFNYLCAVCIMDKATDKPYFENYDAFINYSSDEIAVQGATKFASLLYEIDEDYEKSLIENKFLTKHGFMNDDLHLINSDGKLVDEQGRLVNKDGRFINEQGEYVNDKGERIDEKGNYVVEFSPFLDDEGNPIGV